MEGVNSAILRDAISSLTRENERLESKVYELKEELRQTKAMLQACNARSADLLGKSKK
jgi:cell division septum initiation protein DivIVA